MKNSDSNKRIRELISELGVTQTEFCKKTGINKSALSNYLNGDRLPRQDQIDKIAQAYNINPAWLMGYEVPKTTPKMDDRIHLDAKTSIFIEATPRRGDIFEDLLNAAKGCTPEQVKTATEMLTAFRQANRLKRMEEHKKLLKRAKESRKHAQAIRKEVQNHAKSKKIT